MRALVLVWTVLLATTTAFVTFATPARAQQPTGEPTETTEMLMIVGEQQTLDVRGAVNWSVGVDGIIEDRLTSSRTELVLKARRAGFTTLRVFYGDGRIVEYRIEVRTERPDDRLVRQRDNIRLDLYFVQVSEQYQRQVGLRWGGSSGELLSGNLSATLPFEFVTGTLTSATGTLTATAPLPRLDLLEQEGWAKVLNHATVVTANGTPARYFSGGTYYFAVSGIGAGNLQGIDFGSIVSVQPVYDPGTGRIEMKIETEISELGDAAADSPPTKIQTTSESVVNVELGDSVMLGGLVSSRSRAATRGLPGLSRIPIIGLLFGQETVSEENVQNVLFIVPSLVDTVAAEERSRIEEAMRFYWEFDGGLRDRRIARPSSDAPSSLPPAEESSEARSERVRSQAASDGAGGPRRARARRPTRDGGAGND